MINYLLYQTDDIDCLSYNITTEYVSTRTPEL